MLDKSYTTTDLQFLAEIRKLPCIACGKWGSIDKYGNPQNEAHHIKSVGSGGGDDWFNVIPLCTDCHTAGPYAYHRSFHKFFKKYPHVWRHLNINLGWKYESGSLFRPVK